jgi:hypothetical protein
MNYVRWVRTREAGRRGRRGAGCRTMDCDRHADAAAAEGLHVMDGRSAYADAENERGAGGAERGGEQHAGVAAAAGLHEVGGDGVEAGGIGVEAGRCVQWGPAAAHEAALPAPAAGASTHQALHRVVDNIH